MEAKLEWWQSSINLSLLIYEKAIKLDCLSTEVILNLELINSDQKYVN